MDFGSMNIGKPRYFCHEVYEQHEAYTHLSTEETAIRTNATKPAYTVESIRGFLKRDENFFALEILDRMESMLHPHVNELCSDAVQRAVIHLLTNKKEKYMNVNDERIKQFFGDCSFKTMQELVRYASKLKLELPDDCVQFIFKNRLKVSTKLWEPKEHKGKKLTETKQEKIKDLFRVEITKQQEKKQKAAVSNALSMTYQAPKEKPLFKLQNYYDKHKFVLSHFTLDEFSSSMIQVLKSTRSNNELQNELFEMLGFEAFELISEMLDNRNAIVQEETVPQAPAPTKKKEVVKRQNNNAPTISSQVIVQSEGEKNLAKQKRKFEKKYGTDYPEPETSNSNVNEQQDFDLAMARSIQSLSVKQYANVHDEQNETHLKMMLSGQAVNVPHDAIKKSTSQYDEITIPPKKTAKPVAMNERLKVDTIDQIGQMVFSEIDSFNHIQSEVLPIAYYTNENMLICAPTGAGKTNIALLAIVQTIKNYMENGVARLDKFKIVYICPMKALACEMAANFSKKLLPLNVKVRECTGDMQLTRKEITETQMLVTTPEKWDVITRKGTSDAELTSLLKLLIIDEVHLLNSDRGPVIEALVARTLRQVLNSQNMIRIVGLSATLPNYIDVSHFLRVNPDVGLFYFDSRYRSVPLTQTFIGVKATKQAQQNNDTDEVCFDKVLQFLRGGHQVMVFVHARNQTSKVATYLKETAQKKSLSHLFEPDKTFKAKKAGLSSNSKALANFLPFGLGIHHAGMLRKDRNEVEKCFMAGAIKVLCCTATLAWGVNLPAHGVIIRGTKLYDSKKSTYVDLDILDVMQIFGRAGRPQFDTSGTGIIITTHDKMHHYLSLMTNQVPIESKLLGALTDNLNAEIVLGSISSIQEAVEWLTFTYLYRRMKMNPQVYGLQYSNLRNDPDLREAMFNFCHAAATALDKAKMIRYEQRTGDLSATNLGRTASYYYINFDTIEVFNDLITPAMHEGEIVSMMCHASEFQQIQVRQEELEDLDQLLDMNCEWNVPGGVENVHGKVNILMQTFLSRGYIKTLSLASDMEYITQSAARIARSLFDIAVHQNKALFAGKCLLVAQMFEQRLWPTQSPMRQFKNLEVNVVENIEQFKLTIDRIRDMDEREIGQAIRNVRLAYKVKACAEAFPYINIEARLQPITRGVIRVKLSLEADFKWSTLYHGTTELFYVWIEDPDNDTIYHMETCTVTKNICATKEPIELIFTVPLIEPRPSQYLVRVSSDRWMHAIYSHALSFLDLQLPESFTPHTDLLELQPLETTVLANPKYQKLYPFTHFNPVQTQIFHCLYHTDNNVLLGAPTGSGKTIAAEICIFRLFNNNPELKVVYIAPLKALVRERVDDWRKKFGTLNKKVIEITGDVTPSSGVIQSSDVIITTPEKWDGMSRGWQTRNFIRDVGLMVIDEIHLLGEDRGPVLEVIVSRTNFISDRTGRKLRIIGLSTAMANARDLATWLGIGEMGLYNFRPSVRPVPIEVHITGFPGKHYCPRMMSMNRPAYQAIRQHAPNSPSLIFCSSRKQTRLTAFDLITYLVTDSDPKQWLHCEEAAMEQILSTVLDPDLRQFLSFGIGIHHAGLQERDRKTVEELFVNCKIQVLIATGTLAWGVNFPAHLVVIKGTEYFDGAIKRYVDMPITDVLQMMGRAGRPQFDTSGVACVFVHDIKRNFYKKFLYEPFPVESNLLQVLHDHVNAEIAAETVPTKTHLMEYMTWTYFFRRLLENPTYYNLPNVEPQNVNQYLSDLVDSIVEKLSESNCVMVNEEEDNNIHYESTFFGHVASFYYLSHKTMMHFQRELREDSTILELLNIMCHATEYALFPVRHNEDKINMALAKHLNLKLHGQAIDSPHIKVYILLHMYLSDTKMPNQEYIVDCKSVLDQALRILQAMIDITSNSGWLTVTLRIIHLIQMLVQGLWMHEPEILALKHVSAPTLPTLKQEFLAAAALRNVDPLSLASLRHALIKSAGQVENAFINVYGSKNSSEIYKQLQSLPWIEMSYVVKNGETNEELSCKNGCIELQRDCDYELVINFYRKGDNCDVQCGKFPKKKDEGWFIILGIGRELMRIKRVSVRRKANVSIALDVPTSLGTTVYTVYLLSDSYLGFDQQYELMVQVKN